MKNVAWMLVLALGLSACGDSADKSKSTQVAVKVNGSEISVHQINAVLAKLPGVAPENVAKVRQDVLSKLIDQQLAYDQAVEKKLDRNPDVMLAVEASKREIIARAYLDQVVGGIAKPGNEEARKYYQENPALFSQRKIYALQEIVLEKNQASQDLIKQQLAAGKNMNDIAAALKDANIKFQGAQGNKAAEQIQLDILPKVAALGAGQTSLIEGEKNDFVIHLVSAQASPIDEDTARPRILQFLQNTKVQTVVEGELQRLKAAAKIEYKGDFASFASNATNAGTAESKPAPSNLEKGATGLK